MRRRVLTDENIPHSLRHALAEFDTVTVQYAGFSGLKNGELLAAAESAGFDVLVTGDQSMEYEQSMKGRNIAVVSLSAPHWRLVRAHVGEISFAVETAPSGSVTRIDCGRFVRPRRPPGPVPK